MSIEVHKIEMNYFKGKMHNHHLIKNSLLAAFENTPNQPIKDFSQKISSTDWMYANMHRPWLDIFYSNLESYMIEMRDALQCKNYMIQKAWFQSYSTGDFHNWHTHPDTNWTNIYYLNMPNSSLKTEILDYNSNEILTTVEVEEGDILSIPASLLHRSAKNTYTTQKVIISFNSDFDGWIGEPDDLNIKENK